MDAVYDAARCFAASDITALDHADAGVTEQFHGVVKALTQLNLSPGIIKLNQNSGVSIRARKDLLHELEHGLVGISNVILTQGE
jgi:hypothetical protein